MPEDSELYWLFSTTAQCVGSIIAVLGMWAVMKLQMINHAIENIWINFAAERNAIISADCDVENLDNYFALYDKLDPDQGVIDKYGNDLQVIHEATKLLKNNYDSKLKIIDALKMYFVLSVVIVVGSILFIQISWVLKGHAVPINIITAFIIVLWFVNTINMIRVLIK